MSLFFAFIGNLFNHAFSWIGAALTVLGVFEKVLNKSIAVSPKWLLLAGFGLLAIGSFQARKDEHNNTEMVISQRRQAEIDKGTLRGQLEEEQHEIEYLREHQTLQANVTVPEQKEGALLGLSRLESSYGSNNKGERINDVWRVGDPLSFNFYYTNFGRVAADSTKGFAKTYIATDRTKTTEVALAEAFKKEADANMKKTPVWWFPPIRMELIGLLAGQTAT